jgi:hypothetical protein
LLTQDCNLALFRGERLEGVSIDADELKIKGVSVGNASGSDNHPTAGDVAPTPFTNDGIPLGINPTTYSQDANGDWHATGGIDTATGDVPNGPRAPKGTFTWFRRLFIRDTEASTQAGKNALVSINHESGKTTVETNQDRALWVQNYTPVNDTTARYGIEAIQAEAGIFGSPTWNGSPDGEAAVASFQMRDEHVNAVGAPALGTHVIRAHYFRRPGAAQYSGAATPSACVRALMSNLSDVNGTGGAMAAFHAIPSNVSPTATNFGFMGLRVQNFNAGGFRYPLFNYAIFVEDYGTNASDYNIFSAGSTNSGRNLFQGRVICNRDVRTGSAGNTDFAGQLTLSSGTASYTFTETYATAPIVVLTNTSSLNPLKVTVTTSGFTVTGTGSDVVNYIVVGRN